MASFSHFWVLKLFLATVLLGSQLASSRPYDGGRVGQDLPSFPLATGKLLDHPVLIGKHSLLEIGIWCVAADGVPVPQLEANLQYACSNGGNCEAIKPGGPCFEPNTLPSHAAYAMNAYFNSHDRNLEECKFNGTGKITYTDPSYKDCRYPGLGGQKD